MGGFRRFLLVFYALAGFCVLAALGLAWYGPFMGEACILLTIPWYRICVAVLMGVVGIGFVIMLLRGLFVSHKPDSLVVAHTGDGSSDGVVTVTRSAISSQAAYLIERSSVCTADHIAITITQQGTVSLEVRVLPRCTVNVAETGTNLTRVLKTGLSALVGDRVDSVTLHFLNPQVPSDITETAQHEGSPSALPDRGADASNGDSSLTGDITVPMPEGGTTHER